MKAFVEIDMPQSCGDCHFRDTIVGICLVTKDNIMEYCEESGKTLKYNIAKAPFCPIITERELLVSLMEKAQKIKQAIDLVFDFLKIGRT